MTPARPPLLLRPLYVRKPWGGRRLETELGRRDLPEGPVGESWEAADTAAFASRIEGGPHDGRRLRDVLGAPFPLLLKVLDAREDLSVQLHPDGCGSEPAKEEAWVALGPSCAVATGDIRGHLREAGGRLPESGTWLTHLERRVLLAGSADPAAPPSLVHVPPRTVHSILAGSLLYEVQNPVDATWRLDDFGRLDVDGAPRPLHLSEAREALEAGAEPAVEVTEGGRRLDARRFSIRLLAPGTTPEPVARAAFFLEAGALDWGAGGQFEVPAGRTVVLPDEVSALHSGGWVVMAA